MADEDEDFQWINYNFPPDPAVIEEVNSKITCDLTGYDPPPQFPSNICLYHNIQVLKLFIDDFDIPKELGNLHKLEHLVLCRCENDTNLETRITKIPTTLKNLRNLKVLDLRNNPLQTFPSQLTELLNLEELHVSNCQLASLPDSLARLQQLKTLDLSNNLFKVLPLCITKLHNLCKLYLSDGRLQNLCGEVKNLVNLERLQLTSNELTSLPEGLFELVNLKKLYLNNNKLTSLHDKVGNLVNLEYLVLNQNKLTKIPETIGKLTELRYLNLHKNMLSCLPESITNLEQIETLLVDNNPLQVPPVHVCNQGIQSIQNYFKARKNTKNIHSKRLKVVVLGESMAGKTSLVNALIKGESTQIDEDDRTFGVVFYHWKPEPDVDELELMVIDCAGQKKYQMTHQLFLSEGALFILAVDLYQYTFDSPESYQENVGQWISLVAARIPRARILVVPTHIDECPNQEEIDLKCRNILTNMKEQREEMVSEIDKKIRHVKKTQEHCIPSEELAKILEQYREQKDNLPVISLQYKEVNDNLNDNLAMNVTPVSNTTLEGMVVLRHELVRVARNKNLSPNIDINLPESWVKIEQEIKKCRKTGDIPCLSIAELQEVLKEQGINVSECELHSCVSYLDAIGELQYFKGIHGLVKNVVINPYWLGTLLKKIFRHDMEANLTYNDSVRKLNVVPFQFEQDKAELLTSGVMTQDLLKCVWSEFLEKSDTIFPQLLSMLTHFGLACEIPAVGNNLDTPDGVPSSPSYLLPWFFKTQRPRTLSNYWPPRANAGQVEVTAGFALSQYFPLGVFMRFSVLCHRHEPEDYEHWQNGFYMKFEDVLIHGSVVSAHKCGTLKVAARAPKQQLDILWRTLLILLEEIQKLLNEWPGLNFVPFTVCPHCIQNGATQPHHFPCNWFHVHQRPKRRATCNNTTDGTSHEVQLDLLFPSKDVLNGYRKPVIRSNEIPDCILKDDLLDQIADKLGTKWPRLARKLDLSVKVDSITRDHRGDTHEQAVEMLTNWKRRLGKDAKIEIVINALREINFNDIADFILSRSRAAVSRKLSLGSKKKEEYQPNINAKVLSKRELSWEVEVEDHRNMTMIKYFLVLSVESFVLEDVSIRKAMFNIPCKAIIGWTPMSKKLKIFHGVGDCLVLSLPSPEDISSIVRSLEIVTIGCQTIAMTLRQHNSGQLGFNVHNEGMVIDVEPNGLAQAAGLKQSSRLVEIFGKPVAMMSHEEMLSELRRPSHVPVVVIPPFPSGKPRKYAYPSGILRAAEPEASNFLEVKGLVESGADDNDEIIDILNLELKKSIKHREKIQNLKKVDDEKLKKVGSPVITFSQQSNLLLGKGSGGTCVYVGISEDGSEVAVKRMLTEMCKDRAVNEIEILKRTDTRNSPFIVSYRDFLEDETFMYLILDLCEETLMEHVEGTTAERLQQHGPRMITEILTGLEFLHDLRILHRDLKPSNILVDVEGRMRLADFGLSRFLNEEETTVYTHGKGTEGWMPAEVIEVTNKEYKGRFKKKSDIQVAGMIAFFILTKGEHPFGLSHQRMTNILEGNPVHLDKLADLDARGFVSLLIEHNIGDRPYANEALHEPFLCGENI